MWRIEMWRLFGAQACAGVRSLRSERWHPHVHTQFAHFEVKQQRVETSREKKTCFVSRWLPNIEQISCILYPFSNQRPLWESFRWQWKRVPGPIRFCECECVLPSELGEFAILLLPADVVEMPQRQNAHRMDHTHPHMHRTRAHIHTHLHNADT